MVMELEMQERFEERLQQLRHLLTEEQMLEAKNIYQLAHEKNVEAMVLN